jgi:TatD DNase family protein
MDSSGIAASWLQIGLAAELQRPVSIHCVKGYGHLLDLFKALTPEDCPPK